MGDHRRAIHFWSALTDAFEGFARSADPLTRAPTRRGAGSGGLGTHLQFDLATEGLEGGLELRDARVVGRIEKLRHALGADIPTTRRCARG